MRTSELCTRVLTRRRVVALLLAVFMVATFGAFYHSEPLRSKTMEKIEQISQTVHTSFTDLTTSRSERSTLDIIVSMYKEDPFDVKKQIEEILSLDPVRDVKEINTVIYVKDPKADVDAVKAVTNASEVIQLANLGREGGTVLTHIIVNWEFLARHTMFIQASMHSFEDAKNRISDYFVPTTGVLPLGLLEECECVSCKDPWDGERTFPRLPQLYSALNGEMCPKHITSSYLGQMLVSARRIHSRPRQIYQHLRAVLESDMEHFIHDDPRQDWAFADDPSEPYFGHTLERSWMLLWGCEDVRILHTCAGWNALGSRRMEGDANDNCQCLDKR